MSEPDLFVICKSCSREVSPYVTECPYCGQRIRKRAPKLERETPEEPRPGPRARVRGKRRPSEAKESRPPPATPWVAPDTRPYGVWVLVGLSLLATLAAAVVPTLTVDLGLVGPLEGDWWRLVTTAFVYDNVGYQFIALVATALFGMHLERRFGRLAAVSVFLLAAAAGSALTEAVGIYPALGANAAALGLAVAWLVDDRRAARRGEDRQSEVLGAYVFVAVLVLLSLAWPPPFGSASIAAAAGGALVGAVFGIVLPALIKR